MRTLFVAALALMFCATGRGQTGPAGAPVPQPFYVQYVTYNLGATSESFEKFRTGLFDELRKDQQFAARFSYCDIRALEYSDGRAKFRAQHGLSFLSPDKFREYSSEGDDLLIPIAVMQKGRAGMGPSSPYYNAAIIVQKNSPIHEIDPRQGQIKTVYLVAAGSASGHSVPLDLLWRQGSIESPDEDGLRRNGWRVVEKARQMEVFDAVANDPNAIGFVWYDPSRSDVRPLLRYGMLPMDIVAISADLRPWAQTISQYLAAHIDLLKDKPIGATGIEGFTDEFRNALAGLKNLGQARPAQASTNTRPLTLALATCLLAAFLMRVSRSHLIWAPGFPVRQRLGRTLLILLSTIFDSVLFFCAVAVALVVLWLPGQGNWGSTLKAFIVVPTSDGAILLSAFAVGLLSAVLVAVTPVFIRMMSYAPKWLTRVLEIIGGQMDRPASRSLVDQIVEPKPIVGRLHPDDLAAIVNALRGPAQVEPVSLPPAKPVERAHDGPDHNEAGD